MSDAGADRGAAGTTGGRRRSRWRRAFGPSFLLFAVVALLSGVTLYLTSGPAALGRSADSGVGLLYSILPRFGAALLIAGFIRVLVSQALIARWVGTQSGISGLLVAEFAGAVTLGGPMTAFSLIAALQTAGADRGVLVAYATGWSLLGMQRILMWEMPLLGADFLFVRLLSCCLIPLLAGLAARRIPFDTRRREG